MEAGATCTPRRHAFCLRLDNASVDAMHQKLPTFSLVFRPTTTTLDMDVNSTLSVWTHSELLSCARSLQAGKTHTRWHLQAPQLILSTATLVVRLSVARFANSGRHVAHEVNPHEHLDQSHLKYAPDLDWLCIHQEARKARHKLAQSCNVTAQQ